jgi:hypothetical protein
MSTISKDIVTRVIIDVRDFSDNVLSAEESAVFKVKLELILNKVLEELIFVREENIVLLMECRNDMHKYWESLTMERIKADVGNYSDLQLRMDNVISKMQLCVLLEKLKVWCV